MAMEDALVLAADPRPGDVIVEVGCGAGLLAKRLGARGFDIDPDRNPPEVAKTEALPLPDAYADLVIAQETLIYCYDLHAALREIARVLKPGGNLVAGEFVTGPHGGLLHAPSNHTFGDWLGAFEAHGFRSYAVVEQGRAVAEFYLQLADALPHTPRDEFVRWTNNLRRRASLIERKELRRVIFIAEKNR